MAATIIDGKQVAESIRAELKEEVAKLKAKGIVPGLAVVLVGEDPASISYVTAKERTCGDLGIYSDDNHLPADTSQEELMALVRRLNADPKINGILVQLPLPGHLSEAEVLMAIDPNKDVDGFHPTNVGKMVVGEKAFLPCTPHGVIQLLLRSGVKLEGAHTVIVGRSNIVGKPLAEHAHPEEPNGQLDGDRLPHSDQGRWLSHPTGGHRRRRRRPAEHDYRRHGQGRRRRHRCRRQPD